MSDRASHDQMDKLLDLMGRKGVLLKGMVNYKLVTKHNFWEQIALQLNAVPGGAQKKAFKWSKMWSDWKNNTNRKMRRILQQNRSVCADDFSPFEKRLLKLMGYNTNGPLNQLQTASDDLNEVKEEKEGDDEIIDNVTLVYVEDNHPLSDKEIGPSSSQDFAEQDHLFNSEVLSEQSRESDEETNHKKELPMENKMNRGTFRRKAQSYLLREKISQRREELRLRALELKLKHGELRLKEKEMNKVNSLMNIEEEKLKYFKEISATLKELLERTSKGKQTLSNVL